MCLEELQEVWVRAQVVRDSSGHLVVVHSQRKLLGKAYISRVRLITESYLDTVVQVSVMQTENIDSAYSNWDHLV